MKDLSGYYFAVADYGDSEDEWLPDETVAIISKPTWDAEARWDDGQPNQDLVDYLDDNDILLAELAECEFEWLGDPDVAILIEHGATQNQDILGNFER